MCRTRRSAPIRHYFSPGNLTALRELALRRTAQRVDEQMVRYMQAHAISGPVGGRRAHAGLHRQRRHQHRRGASCQAHGGQPEGAVDCDPCRDRARPEPQRGRARPDRRGDAAGGTAWRGDGHAARPGRRGHDRRVRARQQLHAHHHRAAAAFMVAGTVPWLAGAAADPQEWRGERARARTQPRRVEAARVRWCRDERRREPISAASRLSRYRWASHSCCTRGWASPAWRWPS